MPCLQPLAAFTWQRACTAKNRLFCGSAVSSYRAASPSSRLAWQSRSTLCAAPESPAYPQNGQLHPPLMLGYPVKQSPCPLSSRLIVLIHSALNTLANTFIKPYWLSLYARAPSVLRRQVCLSPTYARNFGISLRTVHFLGRILLRIL